MLTGFGSRLSNTQMCLTPSSWWSSTASSSTTSRSRSGSGRQLCVPPPNGGDQLRWAISFGLLAVGDVDHHHAGVAPGRVGGVAVHDRVVQAVAAVAGQVGVSPAAWFMPGIHQRPASRGFVGSLMSTVMKM